MESKRTTHEQVEPETVIMVLQTGNRIYIQGKNKGKKSALGDRGIKVEPETPDRRITQITDYVYNDRNIKTTIHLDF